jgi:hypothetical protein
MYVDVIETCLDVAQAYVAIFVAINAPIDSLDEVGPRLRNTGSNCIEEVIECHFTISFCLTLTIAASISSSWGKMTTEIGYLHVGNADAEGAQDVPDLGRCHATKSCGTTAHLYSATLCGITKKNQFRFNNTR